MTKQWQAYASFILESIEKLRRIQQRGDLTADEVLYDAALRNLQTLSEATQQLPKDLKGKHASIPWQEISGFRNILVHNYLGGIDAETILGVLNKNLAPLERAVRTMLESDS